MDVNWKKIEDKILCPFEDAIGSEIDKAIAAFESLPFSINSSMTWCFFDILTNR